MYKKIPLAIALKAPTKDGMYKVYSNYFWLLSEEGSIIHTEGVPICSKDKMKLLPLIRDKTHPGVKIKFVKNAVFIPQSHCL